VVPVGAPAQLRPPRSPLHQQGVLFQERVQLCCCGASPGRAVEHLDKDISRGGLRRRVAAQQQLANVGQAEHILGLCRDWPRLLREGLKGCEVPLTRASP